MVSIESLEQPVCGSHRYFFGFAKYIHFYDNTLQFNPPNQSCLVLRCFIRCMYFLVVFSKLKFSRLLICHPKISSNSFLVIDLLFALNSRFIITGIIFYLSFCALLAEAYLFCVRV